MAYANFERVDFNVGNIPCRVYANYSSNIHDFRSNWHNELEFVYTVSGSEVIYIENDCYTTLPGDIVVINSGRIHTIMGNDWTHHCIIPSDQMFQGLGLSPTNVFLQPLIRDEQLAAAFLNIIKEFDTNRKYAPQFKQLAIQQFLLQIFEKYESNHLTEAQQKKNPNFAVTVKVIDYLRQHLAEDFSIDTIAQEIGITSSYMCRCVKAATGISIIDHLNRLRCYAAKHYLMHSNKKINEIAALCGYQSNSYFAKTYQKIVGCSPNETPRKAPQKTLQA